MSRMLRVMRWVSLGLIVLLGVGIAILELRPGGPRPADEPLAAAAATPAGITIGGPFSLTDDKGHAVTDASYRGRWMLVFFGYTNCPDECPLTLQKMATALQQLGPLADKVAPLFITVDPARDTPQRLADYLRNFDTRIVGLTGSSQQIAAVARAYRVYYAPAEHEASGVDLVSHSTLLYLMDRAGNFQTVLPSDADAGKLAAALRSAMSPTSG